MTSWPDAALWSAHPVYTGALMAVVLAALVTAPLLVFVPAPYGRHAREGWGPDMSARLGWIVMEAPSPICFAVGLSTAESISTPVWVLTALYMAHYLYRAFIYPLRMRADGKVKPVLTVSLAVVFNLFNGGLNGWALAHLAPHLDAAWMRTPSWWIGLMLFALGYGINHHADHVLRTLRKPGETGYKIPRGGAYRWVSCPNYMGEIIEWIGFALAASTAPAAAFALFTAANLVPRAVSHHAWYLARFEDYPPNRRAVVPGLL